MVGMIFNTVTAVLIAYLLGSIPFAYIAGRLKKGIDIRQVGGGNLGALNVIREIGLSAGLAVLFADITKGILSIFIAQWLSLSRIWTFIAGFAAVCGHNWPVFLRFKGGKGAATTLGVLLALVPTEFAISLVPMAIAVIITSNIRLTVAVGLAFLPFIIWLLDGSMLLVGYSVVISLFLILRSLPGLREALAGTERKGLVFDREYHFWQARKR
jgi:glycerol-3-phosphate acyltransferase PlsY